MKKVKKSIALLIAVIMMLALTACGSTNKLASIKNTIAVGDIIEFGAYEQDNDKSNGKETIEWQVLERDGNKILVISKYALDVQLYNNDEEFYTTWERCTLRAWLNGTFLNEAFSKAEQSMIQTAEVSADKNPDYSTDPGNATKDKIFLLSIDEANKYFASEEARMCAPTAYAIANGAWTADEFKVDGEATCWWWLRSPGFEQNCAAIVDGAGSVHSFGLDVGVVRNCVRPAMWIDLDA
jgi:hypothetical protein